MANKVVCVCFRPLFDDVTWINFWFRLLITWSSLHGRDASCHEIWCRYLYPIRSYWFFSKIKDGGSRHLGFDWIKILSWLVRYFTSYKDLNFLSFRTVLFTPPKFQFLGDFTPKNLGAHRSDPQKALLWAERRVLSPHWSWSDAQCDLWPWQSNQKKKKKTVANWLFAQTTHLAVSKSKFACRVASGV